MSGDQQAQFQQFMQQRQAPGANGGGMQPMYSQAPGAGGGGMGFGQGIDETMQQQAPGGAGMLPQQFQIDPSYQQQGLLQMQGAQPQVNNVRANGQPQRPMLPQAPIAGYAPEYAQGAPAMTSRPAPINRIRTR